MKRSNKIISLIGFLSILIIPINVLALNKTETVYTTLNGYGGIYKTTVTSHLSELNGDEIRDETYLKEILNINGDENFSLKDNKLTWSNKGKDIFYQGEYSDNYPLETNITYYLNNKEIKLEDLKNKSGKIKIKIKFNNKLSNKVKVNGKYKTLYTPFVTTVGTVIDSNAKNIKINNGKVLSTGSKNVVVGLASPGLYKSINLDEFRDFNDVIIEYETTKFNLGTMYIVSTPKLLDETDFKVFDKMDELYLSINELQINMNKIEKGAKQLEIGANKLEKGSDSLVKGFDEAITGIEKINTGSTALDSGVKEVVTSLKKSKSTLESSKTEMTTKLSKLNDLKTNNTATMNSIRTKLNNNLSPMGITLSNDDVIKLYEDVAINHDMSNPYASIMANDDIASSVGLIYLLSQNNNAISQSVASLNTLMGTVENLINSLTEALETVSAGTGELNSGITSLKDGIKKLHAGSKELNGGLKTLNKGMTDLSNGTSDFNKKGIKKLSSYANKLKDISDTAEALTKLSKNYKGYASKNSNETIFIATVKNK